MTLPTWMDMLYHNLFLIRNWNVFEYLSVLTFDFVLNDEESDIGYMLMFGNDYPVYLQPLQRFTVFAWKRVIHGVMKLVCTLWFLKVIQKTILNKDTNKLLSNSVFGKSFQLKEMKESDSFLWIRKMWK